jgi:DNA-binding transcriptional LysR family regulator
VISNDGARSETPRSLSGRERAGRPRPSAPSTKRWARRHNSSAADLAGTLLVCAIKPARSTPPPREPHVIGQAEAEVAIRVVYDRKTLPLNLHGLKGPELFGGVYMSCDRLAAWRAGALDPIRWTVISMHGIPDWASEGEVRTTGVPFRTTDAEAQIVAVRQGLGMTTLPCFVGDADPLLVRAPGTDLHMHGTLWLLTQGETRKTKRVRLFTEFVSRRLAVYAPLLAGLSISRD